MRLSSGKKTALKVGACAATLGAFALLAVTVGDSDYHATLIGWAPLLMALALIGLAFAYMVGARRSLAFAESSLFAHCERGDKVPFSVDFENRGPLLLLGLKADMYVADFTGAVVQSTTVNLSLGPKKSCTVPLNVPFEHIGLFSAGLKSVTVTDFLGLFQTTIENDRRASVAVLPRVPRLGSVNFSDDTDKESMKLMKAVLADSLDYAYVRDYEQGDPLKTIHWKLSARTDHYLTRLFEKSLSPGVTVVVDLSLPDVEDADEAMELRDTVVESALAVADFARSRGLDTDIRYIDRHDEAHVLGTWDEDAVLGLVREMPQSMDNSELGARVQEFVAETASSNQCQSNLIVCSAQVNDAMAGVVAAARRMRKSPFFVAAVPRRLVDRDLERYLAPLAALESSGIGYQAVSRSEDLEGRDVA